MQHIQEQLRESDRPKHARGAVENDDEELDVAAQGQTIDVDDDDIESEVESEIDAAGAAAGLVSRDDKPFRGVEEVDRRDVHRWELDPDSRDQSVDD